MEYDYEEPSEKSSLIGRIFKIAVSAFVIGLFVWVALRSCWQKGTDKTEQYIWTEEAVHAYNSGRLTVKEYIDYNESNTEKLFYIDNVRHTEELSQFQFTLRYNTYAVDTNKKMEGKSESFCFVLIDNKGNRYTDYQFLTDEVRMYRFFRLVFSDIDITDASELRVRIYSTEDGKVNYKDFIDTCLVWQRDGVLVDEGLSKNEKKSDKPTLGLNSYKVVLTEQD